MSSIVAVQRVKIKREEELLPNSAETAPLSSVTFLSVVLFLILHYFFAYFCVEQIQLFTMFFSRSVFCLLVLGAASANKMLQHPVVNEHVLEAENLELSVELMSRFHSWVEFHDKKYDSHEEKMKRLKIWIQNDGAYEPERERVGTSRGHHTWLICLGFRSLFSFRFV
jgi:hypothetical protein